MAKQPRNVDVYRVYVQSTTRRADTPHLCPRLLLVDEKDYGTEHELGRQMIARDFRDSAFCYVERVGHGNVPT